MSLVEEVETVCDLLFIQGNISSEDASRRFPAPVNQNEPVFEYDSIDWNIDYHDAKYMNVEHLKYQFNEMVKAIRTSKKMMKQYQKCGMIKEAAIIMSHIAKAGAIADCVASALEYKRSRCVTFPVCGDGASSVFTIHPSHPSYEAIRALAEGTSNG